MLGAINGDSNIKPRITGCHIHWEHKYNMSTTSKSWLPSQAQSCQRRHATLLPGCPGPIMCIEMG